MRDCLDLAVRELAELGVAAVAFEDPTSWSVGVDVGEASYRGPAKLFEDEGSRRDFVQVVATCARGVRA